MGDWVKIRDDVVNRKAVVNMKNNDFQSFKWCITRALNPIKTYSERITDKLRMQSNDLKWGEYN